MTDTFGICEALTAAGHRCPSRASRRVGDRSVCCRPGHDLGPFVEHPETTMLRERLAHAERNIGTVIEQRDNYARVMMDMCAKFIADIGAERDARLRAASMAEQVVRENDWLYRRTVQDCKGCGISLDRDLATIAAAFGQSEHSLEWYAERTMLMASMAKRGRWTPKRPEHVRVVIEGGGAKDIERVDGFVECLVEMVLACRCDAEE